MKQIQGKSLLVPISWEFELLLSSYYYQGVCNCIYNRAQNSLQLSTAKLQLQHLPVADPTVQGGPVPPFFYFFSLFLQKRSLLAKTSIKRVRNLSQNIILEMAILETQTSKNFRGWGACSHTPLESSRLRRSLVSSPF